MAAGIVQRKELPADVEDGQLAITGGCGTDLALSQLDEWADDDSDRQG